MKEIEISGRSYRINKLTAIQQFHVSRILMPVIYAGAPYLTIEKFSQLSDRDAVFIVDTCLSVTERKQDSLWARIGTLQAPMFGSDMILQDYYEIVAAVIKDSIGNFFSEMGTKIAEAMGLTSN